MPVKHNSQARVSANTFLPPHVQPGDRIIGCNAPQWRERDVFPGVCLKSQSSGGMHTITMQLWLPTGPRVLEGCVHRNDPEITIHPDRFGDGNCGVWELAPETVSIHEMLRRLDELERRLADVERRPPPADSAPADSQAPIAPGSPKWPTPKKTHKTRQPVSA